MAKVDFHQVYPAVCPRQWNLASKSFCQDLIAHNSDLFMMNSYSILNIVFLKKIHNQTAQKLESPPPQESNVRIHNWTGMYVCMYVCICGDVNH